MLQRLFLKKNVRKTRIGSKHLWKIKYLALVCPHSRPSTTVILAEVNPVNLK